MFILASVSPRRKELLSSIVSDFTIIPSDAEELSHGEVHNPQIVFRNAIEKAESVAIRYPDALVLGADTVIEFEEHVIGKPVDKKDAARILSILSGKKHFVITALCLRHINKKISCVFAESTEVEFLNLSEETINNYIRKVNTLDKAGAYAIQEYGEMIIKEIRGTLDNVIGLPRERLAEAIYACGFGSVITKRAP